MSMMLTGGSPSLLILYVDASYRVRQDVSRFAWVALVDYSIVDQHRGICRQPATSTGGELWAIAHALSVLLTRNLPPGVEILVRCDNQGIIDCLQVGSIRSPVLKPLFTQVQTCAAALADQGHSVLWQWIPRDLNSLADAVCRYGWG